MDPNAAFVETATVYPGSTQTLRSELNLFNLPGTDVSTLKSGELFPFYPQCSLKENYNPVEFVIQCETGSYIDFSDSTLAVTARIVRQDGTVCDATDKCAPSNLFFHTMFSNLEVYLNGVLVSDSSNGYEYISYLQRLLTSSPLEKENLLRDELWYPDASPEAFEADKNDGFKKRYELAKNSKEFCMLGQIVSNITTQPRYLPGGTEIRFVLRRSQPEFCLDSKETEKTGFTGVPWRYEITNAVYFACKKPVIPQILHMHQDQANRGQYKFPCTELQVRSLVIPQGVSSHSSDTIINGRIPRMVVVGLVSSKGYHGVLDKSPFNFVSKDLTEISFSLNSETLDTRTIPLSFSRSNSGTDNFLLALRNLRKCAANQLLGNAVNRDNFTSGNITL